MGRVEAPGSPPVAVATAGPAAEPDIRAARAAQMPAVARRELAARPAQGEPPAPVGRSRPAGMVARQEPAVPPAQAERRAPEVPTAWAVQPGPAVRPGPARAVTGSGGTGDRRRGRPGGSAGGGAVIVNDTFWKDSAGTSIYSQGGGALQVGDTYYWYGVNYGGAATYAADPSKGKNSDESFSGITAYSSTESRQLEAGDHFASREHGRLVRATRRRL